MISLVLSISMLIVIIDQLIKYAAIVYLKPVRTIRVIGGLLNFTYIENRGAAFGIMQNSRWLFVLLTAAVIAAGVYIVVSKYIEDKLFLYALMLLIGGGAGNLIDRLFRGYVIDYINLSFFSPVFNFADCCVTVGAVLLMIYIFTHESNDNRRNSESRYGE